MAWHQLCNLSTLKNGQGQEFLVGKTIVALFLQDSKLYATDGMCAHQGGPLAQGLVDGECITCPWHGWQYDLNTGNNLRTGKKMLDRYDVEVRGDQVWIEIPCESSEGASTAI
ncbi:Rieske (2Fe-2S) protein [Aureliella helgolandensis]|uniref:Methylxanthine N1-demethylase NdmA n=1 Tax=Aureliella helgolandensis TaxID=2527968 RepID=A0A518GEW0_9BACT|nr:Rieske (2Fe-2S) protein [Aureliella helgolandensis]QDV27134.1 Methylxanthine N1-demethylase NdmA [Aureliella helgolandensis]